MTKFHNLKVLLKSSLNIITSIPHNYLQNQNIKLEFIDAQIRSLQ